MTDDTPPVNPDLLADIEACARATRSQSWPLEMGDMMGRKAERVLIWVRARREAAN